MALNSRDTWKGIGHITQGAAGFLLVVSVLLYLFFSGSGDFLGSLGTGIASYISTPVLTISAASVLLIIGTILKFRVWVPAVFGGGLGLLAAVGLVILIVIVALIYGFMGAIAYSGGQ